MKHFQFCLNFLLVASSLGAQTPEGIYKMQNGEHISIGQIEGKPFLVYDNKELRGIRPGLDHHTFEIGNAFGLFETIEGQLQFMAKDSILWKRQAEVVTGRKVQLVEKEVSFKNQETTLSGTLILPEGNGPFPCILFTHGSGPQTRESDRSIANLFASQGIAALIFDKRGVGKSSGKDWQASFDQYAGDAIAGAEFLKRQSYIQSSKIGIYGHSQGGWIAPLAISKSNVFSFAIISAANAISPVEQHLGAGDEEYRMSGMDEATLQEVHDFRLLKYHVGITGEGKRDFNNKFLPEAEKKPWFKTTGGNLPESPFWKANGFYDPAPALKSIRCPILVIYGELDISTNTHRNLPLMKSMIGSKDVEYKVFQNTNHMMMNVDKKGYASKQLPSVTQFADGYVDTLIHWTKRVVKDN